jgi:5,10-methylenetetrahydromethanopterin reductase
MRMEFGIGTGRNERIDEIAGESQHAENLGFSHITFIDSQNLCRDVYAMMTIAALNTRRIQIGHGVTNSLTRHPVVTANATATINELSGGRAFVGIGAGMSAVATLGQKPRPMQEFRESIEFIKRYTAGDEVEFRGAKMHSEWIRRAIRVYLAVDGPKSCQMAGEIGDGALLTSVDPAVQKWRKELVARGAERAGRDPSEIDRWARTMCYVAESKEAARREVASYAATIATQFYFSVLRWNTPDVEELRRRMDPDLLDEIKQVHDAYDYYQHEQTDADHSKLVSQRVIDLFVLSGTPDDICEQIAKLGPIGITTVSMTIYTIIDKKGMMQEISDKILPHFRN